MKVLQDRPANAVEVFEGISSQVRKSRVEESSGSTPGAAQDQPAPEGELVLAQAQKELFAADEVDEALAPPPPITELLPDLMDFAAHFESGDVGIAKEDLFRMTLSLKKLSDVEPLKTVRFWGKIIGLESSYYVAEGEFREGEGEEVPLEGEKAEGEEEPPAEEEPKPEEDENADPGPPKSTWVAPMAAPREEKGMGCNKFTYWVCSFPGGPWTKLPPVTPAQISVARDIKKFFTGRLDAEVVSFPPFPGKEAALLRAQIARITAATSVSPLRYYIFDEDDEEDAELEGRDTFIQNVEYEGMEASELVDLSNWTHHSQYILPQGRTVWFNTSKKGGGDDDDDEERSEVSEEEEVEPQTGPSLLAPLSEDMHIDDVAAWSVRQSSTFAPLYASVHLHSNRWPGAHAVAVGRKYANIYIGYGQKHSQSAYSPPLPPPCMSEYAGDQCNEVEDPSAEEEKQLLEMQKEDGEGANESEPEDDEGEDDEEEEE